MTANEFDRVEPTEEQPEERRRRAGWVKLGIAGLAILGIGGVLTTAAWQQQAIFEAEAEAATLGLQASATPDGSGDWTWETASSGVIDIEIAPTVLKNLIPNGGAREIPIAVKNNGSGNMSLKVVLTKQTGAAIFEEPDGVAATINVEETPFTLTPGEKKEMTVTVTPGDLRTDLQGATGTLTVTATAVPAP
ncbi:hypothetical protein [Agromyces larvae]|uniref:Alternate-type signal peptide domain-containing protein n=1 Tax=Agromyces larvae TaxID=2929802 RepID=A0ABY4C0C7_9MICO|nr:hypothetical protein [Agromyces larvae]UOE44945.1 hypothetical protein MTO99_03960 [Agromyces larvae]